MIIILVILFGSGKAKFNSQLFAIFVNRTGDFYSFFWQLKLGGLGVCPPGQLEVLFILDGILGYLGLTLLLTFSFVCR